MKKFYSFVLLAATLLLSTNIGAQTLNVAKSVSSKPTTSSILYIMNGDHEGYYDNQDECWKNCSTTEGEYTSVKIVGNADITIPAGVYVSIVRGSYNNDNTITNNGYLQIPAAGWNAGGSFINNGTMETAAGNSLSFGYKETQLFSIKNNGTLRLSNPNHEYKTYFTLINNEGGKVFVIGGKFYESVYENIKQYIVEGSVVQKDETDPNTPKYIVTIPIKVNGQAYSLNEALKKSSQSDPAVLESDYICVERIESILKDSYLNLNGHTLTLNASSMGMAKDIVAIGKDGQGGSLTVSGTGTIKINNIQFLLRGSANSASDVVSAITIGEDVTIVQDNTLDEGYAIGVAEDAKTYPYGIVVKYYGKFEGQRLFSVNGGIEKTEGKVPEFNIGESAVLNCSDGLAYAAGYGIWNYEGTATTENFGFEIRAGKFTMNGGSITCNAATPADDQYNGNGSTSQACGIAVCQHSTKLPIEVVVSGGEIKAYTPLYQANPQNNADEINDVKMTVTGGKFFATSKNVVWALNKRIFLEGGLYNQNPSVYAAADKVAVANPDEKTNTDYPWTIGDVKAGITFNGTTDADWSKAANWSDGAVATAETPVTIDADVTISGKAEAYGITVNTGKKITVKAGGVLMVGKAGISGVNSADQLIIEDGGALLISPAATTNNQPLATAKKNIHVGKKAEYDSEESPYVRYHMGIPTKAAPESIVRSQTVGVREWNTVSGWQDAVDYFATPFKGYSATSTVAYTSQDANVDIAFAGEVNGNANTTLNMPRQGFHFFANSWLAPMDAYEILNQLNSLKNKGLAEPTITIFLPYGDKDHSPETWAYISANSVDAKTYDKIYPMDAFILFANSNVNVNLDYEKAVWNAQATTKQAAPKRVMAAETDNNAVRIKLMAANGRQDNVYIYDGEEFHSTKMMNAVPNVNIYVEGEGNYSTFASEDLEGTMIAIQTNSQTNYSLSFDFVKGETLYIKDLQTNAVIAMTEGNMYNFTATAHETSRRFIVSRHNTTTTVDNISVNAAAKGVYSITGQYLGESNIVETLPQGIYVVDGKKVIK